VRTGLGWGTAAEQGFTATYRVAVFAAVINAQQCLSLPDGRSVNVWYSTGGGSGATWQYVAGCG
jgi:hypothetical protein